MKKKKILIIEDETIIALNIKVILEMKKLQVCAIGISAQDAIDLTEKHNPDLILMDISLAGDRDGIDAVKEIKRNHDIPIIYLTAHSDKKTLERAKKTEPYGYIIKPIGREELLTAIEIAFERYKTEKKLKKNGIKYLDLYDNAPDMYLSINAKNGRITECNRATAKALGYKKEEIIGMSIFDIYTPESANHAKTELFPEFLKIGKIEGEELQVQRKNGSIMDVCLNVSAIRDKDGNILASRSIWRDITERIQADKALQLTQFTLENIHDAVYWMGPDAGFIYINKAACDSLGYTREELLSMKVHDIDPEFPAETWSAHWDDLRKRGSFLIETTHQRKDGKIFPVEISVNYIKLEDSEFNCAIARNISSRRESEELIKTSLLEKETLLKEIHHRVKNNMQIICSILSLQAMHINNKSALKQFEECRNRINAMSFVHEKLYESRNLSHIDYKEYIKTLIKGLYQSYGKMEKDIPVAYNIGNISLGVDTAIPCSLIINELVSNIIKHAFPDDMKGNIKIDFRKGKKNYCLRVIDNGTGMPEDTDINKAPSLGLQLVNALIKQLRGKMSITVNNGTDISITFPVK